MLGRRFRERKRIPYMLYREQEILEELILNLKPGKVLEWGSGFSTLHFPGFLSRDASWKSVESDEDWAYKITNLNSRQGVEVRYFQPDSYLDAADSGPYDLIIIDGLFREECLKRSLGLISDRSCVFLHDANRKEYNSFLSGFRYRWILTDYRRSAGGVAILSNSSPIESFLNTNCHERSWSFVQNRVAKILAI